MVYRILAVMLVLLAALPGAAPAEAQTGERCFPETGYCISGAIRRYWERNGGLRIFGYPIAERRVETVEGTWTGPVQWFERARLEDHGAEGVLAGRLGVRYLEQGGTPWESFDKVPGAPPGCMFFQITNHSLCEPFLGYWQRNGGLARFGYPITEPLEESTGEWSGRVQYFERVRMEHHPELSPPYTVLLGLLGRSVYAQENAGGPPREANGCYVLGGPLRATAVTYYDILGCPSFISAQLVSGFSPGPRPVPVATQPFERGRMIWFNPLGAGASLGTILVATPDGSGGEVFRQFQDTWQEGQPIEPPGDPPEGLYAPVRGFGKVWSENADVRDALGWATQPEQGYEGAFQPFARGSLVYVSGANRVLLVLNGGRLLDVPPASDSSVAASRRDAFGARWAQV